LTGTTPFTETELEKAGMLEMLRVIREQRPTKPSTKLRTAGRLSTLAANRGTDPGKLRVSIDVRSREFQPRWKNGDLNFAL
jgi:eukaryotic-like serine/threonine-protein kinase